MGIDITSLLLIHFLCNAQAAVAPVSVSDATYCSSQFETLKVMLHPGITLEEFHALEDSERSRMSVEAYGSYKRWLKENPETVRKLEDASALMVSVDH